MRSFTMALAALAAALQILFASNAYAQTLTVVRDTCPVLRPPQPVCSSTGRSFRSACVAQKAGVYKYSLCGYCPVKVAKKCKGTTFSPYCCDEFTYFNLCSARAAGVPRRTCKKGICPEPIMCALCVKPPGEVTLDPCTSPTNTNPCKGKKGLTCKSGGCSSMAVTDTGRVITTPVCKAYYVNAAGLVIDRCLPKQP